MTSYSLANKPGTANNGLAETFRIVSTGGVTATGGSAIPPFGEGLGGGYFTGGNSISNQVAGPGGYFVGGNATVNGLGGDGIDALQGVGNCSGTPCVFAGQFFGDVTVTGNLSAASKNFRIDHPLDPANKYLQHSSVESSEMKNIYDGIAFLDESGEATVQLPEWFETLNKDFRYQLTAIGAPAPNLYIAQEVQGNKFRIGGGRPGMRVSWLITGVRQDAFAKAHPLQVEADKPEHERGFYCHPELYGQPEEKQTEWSRRPALMQKIKETRARQLAPRR